MKKESSLCFVCFVCNSFVSCSLLDAESIRVHFDPNKIQYEDLLSMFFAFHTPANPKWSGTQYRSAIFVSSPEQQRAAEAALKEWGAMGEFVSIENVSDFYKAEEYHQRYLDKF